MRTRRARRSQRRHSHEPAAALLDLIALRRCAGDSGARRGSPAGCRPDAACRREADAGRGRRTSLQREHVYYAVPRIVGRVLCRGVLRTAGAVTAKENCASFQACRCDSRDDAGSPNQARRGRRSRRRRPKRGDGRPPGEDADCGLPKNQGKGVQSRPSALSQLNHN